MARILIVTPHFPPDLGPSAPLFGMLSRQLVRRGHAVTVLSAVPHYPSGRVPAEFRAQWIQRSEEDQVKVVRIRVPSGNRCRLSWRFLQFVIYQLGAAWAALYEDCDVVLASNPALAVWMPFAILAGARHRPAVFSVHDLYPDVGIDLGVFRSRLVIRLTAWLERYCLRRSAHIRYLSESFIPGLRSLDVPDAKMALIYDWVDTELIRPLPRQNSFSQEHGLDGLFTVLYAGNVGLSQGLETVLESARILAGHPEIVFVFVGDGSGRERLAALTRNMGLPNVRFLPFQPRNRLPEVLATADASLVVLRKGLGSRSLPSKTFSILASGRPVLANVDAGSDAGKLLDRSRAGLCLPPEDPQALSRAILALREDASRREWMGANGRLWAETHHSPEAAAEQFERLLLSAIGAGGHQQARNGRSEMSGMPLGLSQPKPGG